MKTTAFFIPFFIVALGALVVGGCGPDQKSPSERTWVDHGAPEASLEGTKGLTELPLSQVKALENWFPYRERTINGRSSSANVKSEREIRRGDSRGKAKLVHPLKVEQSKGALVVSEIQGTFSLHFKEISEGIYGVSEFRGQTAELVHFSRHPSREVASLLIRLKNGDLAEIVFASIVEIGDQGTAPDIKSAKDYSFMYPTGGRWRQKVLTIGLCGFPGENEVQLAKKALGMWQQALGDRLQLNVAVYPRAYAPFSDINVHCIYWDRTFKPDSSGTSIQVGKTSLLEVDGGRTIIDSDVHIYETELAKQQGDAEFVEKQLQQIKLFGFIHEIGHLLGLQHPSRVVESVMNYQRHETLQEYDIKAIQALYSN